MVLLDNAIIRGEAPGCREKNYNMQAAYDDLADKFVRPRVDAWRAIDELDLREDMKGRWKAAYLSFTSVPAITPAQILAASRQIDTGMLLYALSPERPAEMAGDLLDAIMSEFVERIKDATGNEHVLDGMGADDAMELAGMVVDVVKAQDERVGPAVLDVWQKLENEVHEYCDAKRLGNGAHFAKMLVRSSGADMAPEIMPKQAYLAFVAEDVEAVLDECGISDENARSTVKQQMLERGNADFAAATGLKGLSDSLAAIKAAARDAALPFAPKPPPRSCRSRPRTCLARCRTSRKLLPPGRKFRRSPTSRS